MFENDSTENYDPQVIYREVQSFNHSAVRILTIAIDIVIFGNILITYFTQKKLLSSGPQAGKYTASFYAFTALMLVFMIVFSWFLLSLKLITEIRSDYLLIRLRFASRRVINYEDIAKIEILPSSGIIRKSSWGYHLAPGFRFYSAPGSADASIKITLKNNLKIILSSKDPEMIVRQIRDAARSYGITL